MKNPLIDKEFLKALDEQRIKEIYAKVIALDFNDNPIEEIQGTITQGGISVEGSSAVRRSCSLTMSTKKMDIHEYYWGLKTKFKLFIGVKNNINNSYPDIIWFPQGVYIISTFDTSQDINSYNISIKGNDKMSLLNGEVGGVITALTVDFGTIDEIDERGDIQNSDLLIKDIIVEAVHEYAKEPFHNIIVNDLDDVGVELMEYRGTRPLYMIVDNDLDLVSNLTLNGSQGGYFTKDTHTPITLDALGAGYDHRIEIDFTTTLIDKPTYLQVQDESGNYIGNYSVIKVESGDVVGYRVTDLTYAGDLISNVGETVTNMLDKIVGMLGEFEYFYNTDGQFIFQRKKNYIQTSFNNIKKDGDGVLYGDNAATTTSFSYSFENSNLISSFSNNPDYQNLRNDFSIWGTRKSVNGNELPVHLRCAIDTKPIKYTTIEVSKEEAITYEEKWETKSAGPQSSFTYTTEDVADGPNIRGNLDWREILYQMAIDHGNWHHLDGFNAKLALANPWRQYEVVEEDGSIQIYEDPGYPDGYTGYEQYYTDLKGFWRQLYNPDYKGSYHITYALKSEFEASPQNYYWYKPCTEEMPFDPAAEYFIDTIASGFLYKPRLTEEQYSMNPSLYFKITQCETASDYDIERSYYKFVDDEYDLDTYWSVEVSGAPESLNFWFDFLDSEGELSKYSVQAIGSRPKAENNADVKAIYFREVPEVIFFDEETSDEELLEQREMKQGFTFIRLPDKMENLFSISSQGRSAKDVLDNMLYNHSYCTESISLNTIPVYYLEPNTRIFVRDDNSGINGEYLIDRLSIPLDHSGTMSISAVKAAENMY